MGKLKDLASVKTANADSFVYIPPDKAFGASRVLIKPNLGYPVAPPATISTEVLEAVIRGVRRVAPVARIIIAEGVTSETTFEAIVKKRQLDRLLDEEMRLVAMDELLTKSYPNLNPNPVKYASMETITYLEDFDCVISVGAFKKTILNGQPLISASLKNLYGFFPTSVYSSRNPFARGQLHRPSVSEVLQDIYFTIGHYIHGAVVDLTQKYVSPDWRPDRVRKVAHPVGKVIWGDDLLAVDEVACQVAGEPVADYIEPIRALRKTLQNEK